MSTTITIGGSPVACPRPVVPAIGPDGDRPLCD